MAALPLRDPPRAGARSAPARAARRAPAGSPALRARGLVLRRGGRELLGGLDLELGRGVTGLVERSEAARAALVELVLGLERASAGELAVAGLDPAGRPLAARSAVGVVPARLSLPGELSALALERLAAGLYPRWRRKRFFELCARAAVPTRVSLERLAPSAQARLALALALAHRPRLLVLDEPAEVGREGHAALLALLVAERGDVPALLLASEPSRLAIGLPAPERLACERLVISAEGRVRFAGSPAELLARARRLRLLPGAPAPALPSGVVPLAARTSEGASGAVWALAPAAAAPPSEAALGALAGVAAVEPVRLDEAAWALAASEVTP